MCGQFGKMCSARTAEVSVMLAKPAPRWHSRLPNWQDDEGSKQAQVIATDSVLGAGGQPILKIYLYNPYLYARCRAGEVLFGWYK